MNDRCDDKGGVHPRPQRFQTTRWSLVLSARDGGSTESRDALASLCETYWYPLYAFVRRKGHDAESAQDLVQGFFARLMEKGELAAVGREKGKFRSFLMAACEHFLANQADHDRAKKRGGGRTPISIDRLAAEGRYGREPAHDLTAERLFERQWAQTLLDDAPEALAAEMIRASKARSFEVLRPSLLADFGVYQPDTTGGCVFVFQDVGVGHGVVFDFPNETGPELPATGPPSLLARKVRGH